jgi:hypothetical protein
MRTRAPIAPSVSNTRLLIEPGSASKDFAARRTQWVNRNRTLFGSILTAD